MPPRKELQNGIITKYVITYDEQVPGGHRLPQTLDVLGHSLMTTINGLENGKTYKIRVAAATKIGHGPSSVPVEGKVLLQSSSGKDARRRAHVQGFKDIFSKDSFEIK